MKILILLILSILMSFTYSPSSDDYDYIEKYNITVNPNDDGTMDFEYII